MGLLGGSRGRVNPGRRGGGGEECNLAHKLDLVYVISCAQYLEPQFTPELDDFD